MKETILSSTCEDDFAVAVRDNRDRRYKGVFKQLSESELIPDSRAEVIQLSYQTQKEMKEELDVYFHTVISENCADLILRLNYIGMLSVK